MNRVRSFLFGAAALGAGFALSIGMAEAEPDPNAAPFDQDEYSGKTVMTFDAGSQMILSRFYNAPTRGSVAPPLTLFDPALGAEVELRDIIRERPVVLLFGSFGCDILYNRARVIAELAEQFEEKVEFVLVYVREAHSKESVVTSGYEFANPVIPDPKSKEERVAAARRLCREQNLSFRIFIDDLSDRGATRWAAWPVRFFVVAPDRTVVYAGKPGPWGFFPVPGAEAAGHERMNPHADRFNQESLAEFLEQYEP